MKVDMIHISSKIDVFFLGEESKIDLRREKFENLKNMINALHYSKEVQIVIARQTIVTVRS